MITGIDFLNKHKGSFAEFQNNLKKGLCPTCGMVPLKDCDKSSGLCLRCAESIKQEDFDKIFYDAHRTFQIYPLST